MKKHPILQSKDRGVVLMTVFLMITVLTALLSAYMMVTKIELATFKASKDSTTGFYAAEAGLNLRAENIRTTFIGYNTPTGSSPTSADPCEGSDMGSGSFACTNYQIGKRNVRSYVLDHQPGVNPSMIRIPQGELYQNLNAQEYRYTATSSAFGMDGKVEALLQLRFKSRLVPLFQFAAFYNKDLEILPGPAMTLNGPVHTNGDLYLNSNTQLRVNGQVSTAGGLWRGRKDSTNPECNSVPIEIMDPAAWRSLIPSCSSRIQVNTTQIQPFNGMLQFDVPTVTVPEPEVLDPLPGRVYWDKADLRIVLNVDASNNPVTTGIANGVEIRDASDNIIGGATTTLYNSASCNGGSGNRGVRRNPFAGDNALRAVGTSKSFRNNRENKDIRMLDVDMRLLLDCLHSTNWFGTGKQLNDSTEGGLVLFLTVKGPSSSAAANAYGVRLTNGNPLSSNIAGAPAIAGITVVSDQAIYVQGNYNVTNKKPAAALVDSFNVLSDYWYDTGARNFRDSLSTQVLGNRTPTDTTHNLAVMAGTDSTGGIEGAGGQEGGYNGGLENYPRFHENWTNRIYTYRGSLVSLNTPRHVNGAWVYGAPVYNAPNRNWDYDTSFNNAGNLPPITPRFVYLKQELFVRDYEQ